MVRASLPVSEVMCPLAPSLLPMARGPLGRKVHFGWSVILVDQGCFPLGHWARGVLSATVRSVVLALGPVTRQKVQVQGNPPVLIATREQILPKMALRDCFEAILALSSDHETWMRNHVGAWTVSG